jgi:uncharacterized protein with PIN domain
MIVDNLVVVGIINEEIGYRCSAEKLDKADNLMITTG